MLQQRQLENYFKNLNKLNNKKSYFLSSIFNFTNAILGVNYFLFPFNRNLNMFINSVIINNYLRTISKAINPNYSINYQFYDEELLKAKDLVNETYNIYIDSLEKINSIQLELSMYSGVDDIMTKLDGIKNNIMYQMESISKRNKQIDKIYTKVKYKNNDY